MTSDGPALIERIRRLPPVVADGLLGGILAGLGIADMYAGPGVGLPLPLQGRDADALGVVLIVLMAGSLAWRRRHPMAVLAVSGFGNIAYHGLGYPDTIGAILPVLIALYSLAAHADRREALVGALITAGGIATAIFFASRNVPGLINTTDVVANYVIFATAWILGDNVRNRRAYVEQLEARADDLERRRAREAAQAVEQERARLARELHDVIAHTVSVIVVQAGAARRVADRQPERAREALGAIEGTGRTALTDLRRLLGILRDEGDAADPLAPQPTISQVRSLVAKVRDAGLPVELHVEGQERSLPTGIDTSAYRIVQEALTNALKHAGQATAEVRVRYGDDALEVEVVDDGRGAAAAWADGSPGQGLVGMRERVSLFAGELEVGPRAGGGFRVRARLPYGRGARAGAGA